MYRDRAAGGCFGARRGCRKENIQEVLSPRALLERCQEIERHMGRVQTEKWGPRLIDLDLLVYRNQTIQEPDFVLPHPHIGERAFVLAPLMDIAPDLVLGGRSIRTLHAAIDLSGVQPLP